MDTLASLALATEPPHLGLLNRKPHNRNDYIVDKKMAKHIVFQAIYQLIILIILVFGGDKFLPEYMDSLDDYLLKKGMNPLYYKYSSFDIGA